MPRAYFAISKDIFDRVRLVENKLADPTGRDDSTGSALRHLVLIGLDELARNPGKISMLLSPAARSSLRRRLDSGAKGE
jgi:hypothetical protein